MTYKDVNAIRDSAHLPQVAGASGMRFHIYVGWQLDELRWLTSSLIGHHCEQESMTGVL